MTIQKNVWFVAVGLTGLLGAFQNCSEFSAITTEGSSKSFSFSSQSNGAGQLPRNFGAALQASTYNGAGDPIRAFPDGAREAHRLGISALKISMSREAKVIHGFYHLAKLEGVSHDHILSTVDSLKAMAQLRSFDYVLALPFQTIFIQTSEMGTYHPVSNYWNMETVPMPDAVLQGIYKENYDLAVHLLNRFRGTGRTFVLQDHEADWHASVPVGDHYSENTDIGHANFLKYWPVRQKAVDDARRAVASDVKIYNMCEVVRVRESVLANGKSLTRDILPQVNCDLVGYSAHDTALLPDNGETLRKAVAYIKAKARPSAAFGSNNVLISEIAVPELANGLYLPRMSGVVTAIAEYLRSGMPWVVYWQMYDNGSIGNWLVTPGNDLSQFFYAFLNKLGIAPAVIASRVTNQPSYQIPNSPSAPTTTPPTPVVNTPSNRQPTSASASCASPQRGYQQYFCATYKSIFNVAPTSAAIEHFNNLYNQGLVGCIATVRELVKEDPVRQAAANAGNVSANDVYIRKLYSVTLGRTSLAGDSPADLLAWRNAGISLEEIEQVFYTHPEMRARCASFGLRM